MLRVRAIAVALLSLLLPAATAAAGKPLSPGQVVVVANSASEDSLDVAQTYVRSRQIPLANLLAIRMPLAEEVSREDYEKLIRLPILRAMTEGRLTAQARCLCLIYGVPLRVAPEGADPEIRDVYRYFRKESRARLGQLLDSVAAIAPLEARPATAALDTDDLLKEVNALLVRKIGLLRTIPDAGKRLLASRRVVAAYREVYGLRGLSELLQHERMDGGPSPEDLRRQLLAAEEVLAGTLKLPPSPVSARQTLAVMEMAGGLSAALAYSRGQLESLDPAQTDASVDSELALALWDHYSREGPLPNPLYWKAAPSDKGQPPVLMTSRLDGPSRGDVLRMIKSSLSAEKNGLRGKFYIEAGGPHPEYDAHLRKLYDNVKAATKFPAVIEETRNLFAPGSCPEAALYVGWYSPKRYIPSMMWAPGAVGWHIAGCEARDLRDPESPQWCPKMILNGAVATLGAIGEPTLGAFPVPEDFFGLLMTGKYTVAECYWRTVGHVSWRMVLVADPLYNPFAVNPQLDSSALPKGLAP